MFSVESEISVGVRSFYVPLCTEDFSHRQSDDYQQMLTVLGDSIYCVPIYSICSDQFLINLLGVTFYAIGDTLWEMKSNF